MAKLQPSVGALVLLAFLLSAALVVLASTGGASGVFPLGWISGCHNSIADCLSDDEFDLGSEVSRRILSTTRYISYGALKRDTNPYSCSCSTISQ